MEDPVAGLREITGGTGFDDVHYNSTHVMGTTGGNMADMIESLELTAAKRINPAVMVTHVGGLDAEEYLLPRRGKVREGGIRNR